MAAAAGAAARGGPIPDGNAGGHGLRLPRKPVALADITNTGKPNPPESLHTVADVLKENAKLRHLLAGRTKLFEAMQQQNRQLAQANSQLLAEICQGKERLKVFQHELAGTTAVRKIKDSELKETNAMPSRRAAQAEAHEKATAAVPSYTSCQEPTQYETTKRCTNRRKSESCKIIKDTNTLQHSCKPHVLSSGSSHSDDLRITLRRRSARLNPGSCEVTEVSCKTLQEDVIVPLAPRSSVPKQQEPNAGKNTQKSLINELPCKAVAHKLEDPKLKKNKRSLHAKKEVYLEEEIEQADSRVAGVEAHKIDDKATNTDPKHLAVTESSQPFIIEHPELPQDRGNMRKSMRANKRKLESCEGPMASNIEDGINTNCHSNSSMPLHYEEKRKLSSRRKSSRLDPGSCEVTNGTFEIVQDGIVAPSSLNVLIEQTKNGTTQNDCTSSTQPSEERMMGRRSSVGRPSRLAAEKIVSYKEIPLNVKMRRP
ncbi:hypothetical protein GUJ93_ZPchr0006g43036 [Zizania palustris]|uniref:Shugoshin C-terminal domain-containing protein n=1 Tax=Zizania palustris TaxID=103762 RepID=A0A8J5VMU9_ZIZPA|nr:hypothetical protein GUJ93_ZPchr0006g43036 [Zizania palustris]